MSNITEEEFKNCLGKFATGITIVTSIFEGKPYGITVNSFNSVSLNPPLILFSLKKNSFGNRVIRETRKCIVNILSKEQKYLVTKFAGKDKVDWHNLNYEEGTNQCPILTGCLCAIECSVEITYGGGDHDIFLCKVMFNSRIDNKSPLIYFDRKFVE